MLIKILGSIDILMGLLLIFNSQLNPSKDILVICGIFLIAKSLLGFLRDFASWMDLISGATFFILIISSVPGVITLIGGILIIQKGIFSFF
jgi:hypothetical protein